MTGANGCVIVYHGILSNGQINGKPALPMFQACSLKLELAIFSPNLINFHAANSISRIRRRSDSLWVGLSECNPIKCGSEKPTCLKF